MSLADEVLAEHTKASLGDYCSVCHDQDLFLQWPCEPVRLALSLHAAEQVVEAARKLEELSRDFLPDSVYGGFMGGDPRRFHPDPECCSPEEIARHAAACAEWEVGGGTDRGPGCATLGDGANWTGGGFGIGTTTFEPEPEVKDFLEALAEYDKGGRQWKPPSAYTGLQFRNR